MVDIAALKKQEAVEGFLRYNNDTELLPPPEKAALQTTYHL